MVLTLDDHGPASRDARITDIEKHRGVSNGIANRKLKNVAHADTL